MPPAPVPRFGEAEDLERITGVEPWIAELLRRSGVADVRALADLSAEALATALREQAAIELSAERIGRDDWLGQARRLRELDDVADGVDARQAGGFSLFFDVVSDERGERTWQTRIYHEESGQEVVLPGIESGAWAAWILSHALPDVERGGGPAHSRPPELPSVHDLRIRILGASVTAADGPDRHEDDRSVEVRVQVSGLPEVEQALGRVALGAVIAADPATPAHQGGV
jgi:Domain of unknown function (DUF4332)